MIAIDTDVLAIHHVFHNDPRYETTEKFLSHIRGMTKGVMIFNLLELCGIISTARQREESERIFQEYLRSHDVTLLFSVSSSQNSQAFWSDLTAECLARIHRGMRLGDAVILWTLETMHIETFVTWNLNHFKGKTELSIIKPSDFKP